MAVTVAVAVTLVVSVTESVTGSSPVCPLTSPSRGPVAIVPRQCHGRGRAVMTVTATVTTVTVTVTAVRPLGPRHRLIRAKVMWPCRDHPVSRDRPLHVPGQ